MLMQDLQIHHTQELYEYETKLKTFHYIIGPIEEIHSSFVSKVKSSEEAGRCKSLQ